MLPQVVGLNEQQRRWLYSPFVFPLYCWASAWQYACISAWVLGDLAMRKVLQDAAALQQAALEDLEEARRR